MKINSLDKQLALARRRRKGIALLLVLSCLVLLTLLVVALLSNINSELKSSKVYANGASVKLLAQTAVNIAQSEINDATHDGTLCWASQPGMIRTYDNTGAPVKYYKLYSNSSMVITRNTSPSVSSFTASGDYTPNWSTEPALYTDLNSPVIVTSSTTTSAVFPIVDGNSIINLVKNAAGNAVPSYLGYAGGANGGPAVDGFAVDPSQVTYSGGSPSAANTPVPMPVQWLYILQDGSLTTPSPGSSTGHMANWPGSSPGSPSVTNPIVGRIAFWTDDDTCKVNINTASTGNALTSTAGTYWDTPRANLDPSSGTTQEQNFGINEPVQGEYQRYPGHPATTWLNGIFNSNFNNNLTVAQLLALLPRYAEGGSVDGTVQTTEGAAVSMPSAANRLYATTDELMFSPTRTVNNPYLTNTELEQVKFFITANSRAPDVNVFNQPRICVWPISSSNDTNHRSASDQLIAFCSTMRNDLSTPYYYFFQRQDPTSPTVDLPSTNDRQGLDRNRMLLEYLRYLVQQPIPGFGGNFYSKYSTINNKGGNDCDQILTEIFDYIRSTNLVEPGIANPYTYTFHPGDPSVSSGQGQVIPIDDVQTNTHGFGRFRTVQGGTILFIANADGNPNKDGTAPSYTQPLSNPVAQGYMRIQAIFLPQLFDPSEGFVFDNPNFNWTITGLTGFTVNGNSLWATDPPPRQTQNYFSLENAFWGDQFGLRQMTFDGSYNGANTTGLVSSSVDVPESDKTTPNVGGTFTFSGGTVTIALLTPTGATSPNMPVQTVTLNFPGGTFPIPTLAPSNVNTTSAPTSGPFNMRYFDTPKTLKKNNTPTPTIIATANGGMEYPGANEPSLGGRLAAQHRTDQCAFILDCDVARSVSAPSDIRLIAAQKITPSSGSNYPFVAVGNANWGTANVANMHTFFDGQGEPYYGAVFGRLVRNASYDGGFYNATKNALLYTAGSSPGGGISMATCYNFSDVLDPLTGAALNGVTLGSTAAYTGAAGQIPGDWDNGVGELRDGPFINKADEGDNGIGSTGSHILPYTWKNRTSSGILTGTKTLFTPNHMIPSAGMFGSLPTGVFANRPWQTLLFRAGPSGHPGLGTSTAGGGDVGPPYRIPPDHLFLDLFNMPVVEPYAISEPLSTAGRINLNYQIVPFTYLTRDSGMRAVLASENVITISNNQASNYKRIKTSGQTSIRTPVDIDATLRQMQTRFTNNDLFRSPSEICHIDIVPTNVPSATAANPTRTAMDTFWNGAYALTGDNSREHPYATIYPRVTTKSNTFTVHFRVQTLKQALTSTASAQAWQSWREGADLITGEYRGSETIERYIDPNDTSLPDFASNPSLTQTLAPYYKFRVLSVKEFAP